MKLTLTHQSGTQMISVISDDQPSHFFDLLPLVQTIEQKYLDDPVRYSKELDEAILVYGKKLYQALFPPDTLAQRTLATLAPSEYLQFVTTDDDLDAIPWEFAYGPSGFLILEYPFVRGLPDDQQMKPLTLDNGLHIIAVPSHPLSKLVESLDIEGEWIRLKEIIKELPYTITLECSRPPSIERVRQLVANQKNRVIHFMGHGGQGEQGAFLCFEEENGDLDKVTARQFMQRMRGTVFLVTLNACVSATPGPTGLSNLAAALVRQKTPYALGMRLTILDEDARIFSHTFYSELVRGSSVEEALFQARHKLHDKGSSRWVVGVPVLYTALTRPAPGFTCAAGTPKVQEHQPPLDVNALPRAEGIFQGRIDELVQVGNALTGDNRAPLFTIHGGSGQGKTALARESVERFAYAWPGGVWASSLESLPSKATFVSDLARFLGLDIQEVLDPQEVERRVMAQLAQQRTLIVLDNAEILVKAVEQNDPGAIQLGQFLQHLPNSTVSLLVTSQIHLGWQGEISFELKGLPPREGANLFTQSTPQRTQEIERRLALDLSKQLEGHPLSLRLLGGAFNASGSTLTTFIKELDDYLLKAENKYRDLDHRHRTLYACLETSIRYLDDHLCALLSGLWIFQAPFLAESAVRIFDPQHEEGKGKLSPIRDHLDTLWQRGLLTRERIPTNEGILQFYHLLPTTRPYIEHHLKQAYESQTLQSRFEQEYARLVLTLYQDLDSKEPASVIAQQTRDDIERAVKELAKGEQGGYYLIRWGWTMQRLGNRRHGLDLFEQVLELAQGHDRSLESHALAEMAKVYQDTGQLQKALRLYQQILPMKQEMKDLGGEASTLNSLAAVHYQLGQPEEALRLYQQALSLHQKTSDREGEVTVLSNIAAVYQQTGRLPEALRLYQQILPFHRETGDRHSEATTLNNMATLYQQIGQFPEALRLYQQALFLTKTFGDRGREAATLGNIATVYRRLGQKGEALHFYNQALLLVQEVGDHFGEAATLTNLAILYRELGQTEEARNLYQQALSIVQEIGDRANEATILANMASLFNEVGQTEEALRLYKQVLSITHEVGNRPTEAAALSNMASVYREAGQIEEALPLYQQALAMMREIGDREGQASTLSNIATVYHHGGQTEEALPLYQQALSLHQKDGDKVGEAKTLNNMAAMYHDMEQLEEALHLYRAALLITREIDDRATEANILSDMAAVYRNQEQLEEALHLYQQALPIHLQIGDRAGEADTLSGMAAVYRRSGQPAEALRLYQQALPLHLEAGSRIGAAFTLGNMAAIYSASGQLAEALHCLEQALPIYREMGDHITESETLSNIAYILQKMQRYQEAQIALEESITIDRQTPHPAGEAAGLVSLALLLYQDLGRPADAMSYLEQALVTLEHADLSQDAAGHTPEELQQVLQRMRAAASLTPHTTMPSEQISVIVSNTIAVMTTMREHHDEWQKEVTEMLQEAHARGKHWQVEVDFFAAILEILDGRPHPPPLPAGHPYAQAVAAVQQGITARRVPDAGSSAANSGPSIGAG